MPSTNQNVLYNKICTYNRQFFVKLRSPLYLVLIGRILQNALSFVLSIILARYFGASLFGQYLLLQTLVTISVLPVQYGASPLINREIARLRNSDLKLREFNSWSSRLLIFLIFVSFIFITFSVGLFASRLNEPVYYIILLLCGLAAFLNAQLFFGAILNGLGEAVREQTVQNVVRPSILILLIIAVLSFQKNLNLTSLITLQLAAVSISFLLLAIMLSTRMRISLTSSVGNADKAAWKKSFVAFAMIGGMDIMLQTTDILMLGAFSSSDQLAYYQIGSAIGGLLGLPLSASIVVVTSKIARSSSQSAHRRTQLLCISAARKAGLPVAVGCCALLIFGEKFIVLAYGQGYSDAYVVMAILSLSSFVNVLMGLNKLVLLMSGHERLVVMVTTATAFINIALNGLLISQFGSVGAAIATAASVCIWNIWLHYAVHYKVRFGVAIFSRRI